jgi:hypothetical protein
MMGSVLSHIPARKQLEGSVRKKSKNKTAANVGSVASGRESATRK